MEEKKLVGCYKKMSFLNNMTKELWQGFMPKRKSILSVIGKELYSVEVYPSDFFEKYDPGKEFEKWAAVEVSENSIAPEGFGPLLFPKGLYAVFLHKGPASEGPKTYQYIFTQWLPASGFKLDNRPHFAVMGEKYRQDDVASEEEIWIPVMLDA
jgi:AraC family transcriptional regulator